MTAEEFEAFIEKENEIAIKLDEQFKKLGKEREENDEKLQIQNDIIQDVIEEYGIK